MTMPYSGQSWRHSHY